MFDLIFDIITLPFEILGSLLGGGIECLFSCLFLVGATLCCVSVLFLFVL